jgi:hypothetical protein
MSDRRSDMDVFGELIKYDPGLLDRPIEELAPISFIGQAAVAGYRSLVGRLDSLPMTEEQKGKTLKDGQDAGRMLLAIETRIGELLPEDLRKIPGTRGGSRSATSNNDRDRGAVKTTPEGMTKHSVFNARTIAKNPDVVDEVISEAVENEDIPTKAAVLAKIKARNVAKKHPAGKASPKDINEVALGLSVQLDDCYVKLSAIWPEREYVNNELITAIETSIGKLCETRGGG